MLRICYAINRDASRTAWCVSKLLTTILFFCSLSMMRKSLGESCVVFLCWRVAVKKFGKWYAVSGLMITITKYRDDTVHIIIIMTGDGYYFI